MKKIHFLILIIATILCVAAISGTRAYADEEEATEEVKLVAPKLAETKVELIPNWDVYTIRFKDIEDNAPIFFSSSKESVAEVSAEGVVVPKKAGKATILVTVIQQDVTYELKLEVTVKDPYFKVVSANEGCHIGESVVFEVEQHGYEDEVKWTLVGSQYAKIKVLTSTSAKLTGVADGMVKLTLETHGEKKSYNVRILDGTGRVYVVSPNSKPFASKYTSYSSYNEKTKNYYMLRSYLEQLDKVGGGTLLLKEGTYTVTNILCVPSDTQIVLSDGVTIKKSYSTGTSYLSANRSIFHTVSYSNYNKYQGGPTFDGLKGYSGTTNVKIIGEGSATIDLNKLDTCAVVICHAKDVEIRGINFLNMNTNHFLEVDAAKNVLIKNCVFKGHVLSNTGRKEAINIDTPDINTGGFNQDWSSYDGTPVDNVQIIDNIFIDLESAIGTHKYTAGKAHKSVVIKGNLFCDMTAYGIRAMNWDDAVITDNIFYNQAVYDAANVEEYVDASEAEPPEIYGVIINGVNNPTITNNRFESMAYAISCYPWRNTGKGKEYAAIFNNLSETNLEMLKRNYISNIANAYIEFYPSMNSTGKAPSFSASTLIKYEFYPEYQ